MIKSIGEANYSPLTVQSGLLKRNLKVLEAFAANTLQRVWFHEDGAIHVRTKWSQVKSFVDGLVWLLNYIYEFTSGLVFPDSGKRMNHLLLETNNILKALPQLMDGEAIDAIEVLQRNVKSLREFFAPQFPNFVDEIFGRAETYLQELKGEKFLELEPGAARLALIQDLLAWEPKAEVKKHVARHLCVLDSSSPLLNTCETKDVVAAAKEYEVIPNCLRSNLDLLLEQGPISPAYFHRVFSQLEEDKALVLPARMSAPDLLVFEQRIKAYLAESQEKIHLLKNSHCPDPEIQHQWHEQIAEMSQREKKTLLYFKQLENHCDQAFQSLAERNCYPQLLIDRLVEKKKIAELRTMIQKNPFYNTSAIQKMLDDEVSAVIEGNQVLRLMHTFQRVFTQNPAHIQTLIINECAKKNEQVLSLYLAQIASCANTPLTEALNETISRVLSSAGGSKQPVHEVREKMIADLEKGLT